MQVPGNSTAPHRLWVGIISAGSMLVLAACGPRASEPEPVRAVRTQVVETGTPARYDELAAEIKARTESRLAFRVAGRLQSRPAELGQAVRSGEVLARLDPQDLRLGQDAALAALRAASASHDGADADLRRYRELMNQGFISAAELERREIAARVARAQWDQARAAAEVQGNQAVYTTLSAPADGVVTAIEAEPGTVLAAGTPVLRVAWAGPRDAVFAVPEDAVAVWRSRLGRPGVLEVQAGAAKDWSPAVLREISASADPATRTYLAKADVGRPDVALGQSARIRVALPSDTRGVRLPLAAVTERGGHSMVWVVEGSPMVVHARKVTLADPAADQAVVSDGLKPGERVVVAGVHVLTEGQAVKLWQPGAMDVAGGNKPRPATQPR